MSVARLAPPNVFSLGEADGPFGPAAVIWLVAFTGFYSQPEETENSPASSQVSPSARAAAPLLREGARKLLQAAIENEVIDYIQFPRID
jgi:hypothetical protein